MATTEVNTQVIRLAMWSGPRNISTAMMRSWGSRNDAIVCDEPLYAHFLSVTQDERHPGYAETLANHETDWRKVVKELTGPLPEGKTFYYQKQMAHHLLPNIDRDWVDSLTNCLLIRDPAKVLISLTEFFPDPSPEDTGLPQQVELFERWVAKHGSPPPVIDSRDVLVDPRGILSKLCERIGVEFEESMLSWEPGLRDTDGAWAPMWYDKVAKTTGFAPYKESEAVLPESLEGVLAECQPLYDRLYAERIV